MALSDVENEDELREEFNEINEYMDEQERDKKAGIASWVISLSLHGLLVLILSFFVIFTQMQVEYPPVRAVQIPPPVEIREPPKQFDLNEVEIEVTHTEEVTAEATIISDIDLPVEIIMTEEDVSEAQEARGREEAISDSEMGNTGAFAAIGAGGGNRGAFGRIAGGDRRAIGRAFGPNARAVTTIIDQALVWLVRHQSPNGQWDSDNYNLNCDHDPKMEPGRDVNGADEALTGYAVLCFLGAGYDHRTPNRFRRTVKAGVDWLVATQGADGVIGRRNYEHAIATMALAEAFAMTNDPALREPAQRAVNVILQRQVRNGDTYPLGWDYVEPKLSRMDSSVIGWNVMALKSAKAAGLDTGDGLDGSRRWLEGAWRAANPNWERLDDPYTDTSIFPYTWNGETGAVNKDHLSFVGVMCGVFLGEQADSIMLQSLANDMTNRWFDTGKYRENSYALYYASLGAFQVGGRHWGDTWGNPQTGFAPWLIQTFNTQEGAGCRYGTWDHSSEGNWHGHDTSPVLLHVYKLLAMEVAIRYQIVVHRR